MVCSPSKFFSFPRLFRSSSLYVTSVLPHTHSETRTSLLSARLPLHLHFFPCFIVFTLHFSIKLLLTQACLSLEFSLLLH